MNTFLQKARDFGWRNIFQVALLAVAEVFIFSISNFILILLPQAHNFLHISEREVATVIGVFGFVSLSSQLPAGMLADRFDNKKLVLAGLFSSMPFFFWFAVLVHIGSQVPYLFIQYVLICVFWAFASSLLFWASMMRLVSQKASKKEQGTAYGILGTINSLFGIVFVWILGVITIYLSQIFNSAVFFAYYCYFLVLAVFLVGVLIYFFVDSAPKQREASQGVPSVKLSILSSILRNPKIWALSFSVMTIIFYLSILGYYLKDVLSGVLKISTAVVAFLGGLRFFGARFLVSWFGRFADKRASFILCNAVLLIIGSLTLLPFIFLPGFSSDPSVTLSPSYFKVLQYLLAALFVVTGFFAWMMTTIQFTQIVEVPRPKRSYGTTLAFTALIAHSVRAWFMFFIAPLFLRSQTVVNGVTFTPWPSYQGVIIVGFFLCILASFVLFLVYFSNKKELKRLGKTSFRWRDLENF